MSYYLIAESSLAKTYQGTYGPDILITENTKIGRSVAGQGSCRLPPKWAQVSGTHCRVYHTTEKVLQSLLSSVFCLDPVYQVCCCGALQTLKQLTSGLQDPAGYWIEDTSTNGTLVNGARIAKGTSVPVKEGDSVQLSWNAAGEAAAVLE